MTRTCRWDRRKVLCGSSKKKKNNNNNNKNKNKGDNKGSTAAAGGGSGGGVGGRVSAAAGGGGGSGQAAAAALVTAAAVEGAFEELDIGDEEGKEQKEAEAEKVEEAEQHDDSSSSNSFQDEKSFILEGAPNEFFCPITTELMVSPVLAADGVAYEETSIKEWFATCRAKGKEITSPTSGFRMEASTIPNMTHETMILNYIDRKKEEYKRLCAEREASKGGKK